MAICASCSWEIPAGGRFCASCGAPVDTSDVGTLERPERERGRPPSSDAIDHGRFLPGTMLGSRFRIVGLLGKGGMGEVYRADDLKLGQSVALKFLPQQVAGNPARLSRFINEVRTARQIAHPNVCRVYDIGEIEGDHFLSMEYVNGEDLGSLLRRIGRLPRDKAVQIARHLCAGLAAAHAKGVLHRDLKPANVTLDERGTARITDFGLAGLVGEFHGRAAVREGTPAYMAPEQLAGREVSVRSDVYSLGLILYEVFTGKPAFQAATPAELLEQREHSTPASPSSLVEDIDPFVERIILRCLESQPARRPPSALAVAGALPGGDPLAAALAAGDTPSPEMVAAAGETEGLRPPVALACLASFLIALAMVVVLSGKVTLTGRVPLDNSPDVLASKARDIITRLGYPDPPTDSAHGFRVDGDYLRYVQEHDRTPARWDRLAALQPPAIRYWYRQSPRYLEPAAFLSGIGGGVVTEFDPPPVISGMASVVLDPRGRLIEFGAAPPQVDEPQGPSANADWALLFTEAGLDHSRFTPAPARWTPLAFADERAAWEGSYPDRPEISLRVEAAAYRGRPVHFQIVAPWTRPWRMQPFQFIAGQKVKQAFALVSILTTLLGGLLVARRNLRLGRGDRRGAFRLAVFVVSVVLLGWLFGADHVPTFYELGLFVMGLSFALFIAVLFWVLYIALEPYVRRRWPNTLISWSRLLAGRLRDPLVGRDLLVGCLLGAALALWWPIWFFIPRWLGLSPPIPRPGGLHMLLGVRYVVADSLGAVAFSMFFGMMVTFLLFLLRVLLRRQWLAAAAFVLIFTTLESATSEHRVLGALSWALLWSMLVFVLMRFGLLAFVVIHLVTNLLRAVPPLADLRAWHAGASLSVLLVVVALAAYGFHTSLGGRRLFKDELLEG